MPDLECRLAKVEERMSNHIEAVSEMKDTLNEMNMTMKRQQGFMAGVVFAVSSIVAGVTYFLNKG